MHHFQWKIFSQYTNKLDLIIKTIIGSSISTLKFHSEKITYRFGKLTNFPKIGLHNWNWVMIFSMKWKFYLFHFAIHSRKWKCKSVWIIKIDNFSLIIFKFRQSVISSKEYSTVWFDFDRKGGLRENWNWKNRGYAKYNRFSRKLFFDFYVKDWGKNF